MTFITDRAWLVEVSRGNISGVQIISKFGAVTSGASHTTWKVVSSAADYKTPTAATALELVSSDNTNDFHPDNSASKTGAHLVRIYGLKTPASTSEDTEDVKLNGTTAVALASSWWRVYRMKVIESGTYAALGSPSHNSTLTLRVSGAGATWAIIDTLGSLGFSQTEIAAFTIPTGQTAYLLGYDIEVSNTNGSIDVGMFIRENADDITTPFTGCMQIKAIHRNMAAGENITVNEDAPMISLSGPADIGFLSKSGGNQTYDVDVDFQLLCVTD